MLRKMVSGVVARSHFSTSGSDECPVGSKIVGELDVLLTDSCSEGYYAEFGEFKMLESEWYAYYCYTEN